jgi:hypothetical protein
MRITGRAIALATVFVVLASGQAGAAITETAVTSPGPGPLFYNPDLDAGGSPLAVSGTTNSSNPAVDEIDINCAHGNDGWGALVEDVDVQADGSFSTEIDVNDLSYYICRLIAVPAGDGPPFDPADWTGPVVSVGGFEREQIPAGPNAGKFYDFFQASSALQGYWSIRSAGECYVRDSYPFDPVTLGYGDTVFACASVRQEHELAGRELQIDGRTALLPAGQRDVTSAPPIPGAEDIPGLQEIGAFSSSIEDGTGNMIVSSSEPTSFCDPDPTACQQFLATGVRLDAKTTGGAGASPGRTLTVEHDWVNTTGQPKTLHAAYGVRSDWGPGWLFPSELGYASHVAGDTVTPFGDGPASFFIRNESASPCSAADPCGSVTWAAPPNEIFFTSSQSVLLGYDRTIPPGCTARIAFTHSHGRVQSSVDAYANAAEAALASQPSITCPPPTPPDDGSNVPPPAKKKKCKKKKAKGKKGKKKRRKCKRRR